MNQTYKVSEVKLSYKTKFNWLLILQAAILSNASSIILAHNHPSGSLKPSYNDSILTQRIKELAALMNITVDARLIVCKDNYYSFADAEIL